MNPGIIIIKILERQTCAGIGQLISKLGLDQVDFFHHGSFLVYLFHELLQPHLLHLIKVCMDNKNIWIIQDMPMYLSSIDCRQMDHCRHKAKRSDAHCLLLPPSLKSTSVTSVVAIASRKSLPWSTTPSPDECSPAQTKDASIGLPHHDGQARSPWVRSHSCKVQK